MNKYSVKKLLLLWVFLRLAGCGFGAESASTEDLARGTVHSNDRMQWWRDARFGLFIHWGLYAIPAGVYNGKQISWIGEWIMNTAQIPVQEYSKYADQFNPTNFDANAWVQLAKAAGMKYIVITAKHHDGFAMFHTAVDNYNVYDATPFHRDPIKELADACAREGIKFGVYYSQAQDWYHPGGLIIHHGSHRSYTNYWDTAQIGSYNGYWKNITVPQIRELLSNYGPISVLWFDTPGTTTAEQVALLKPLFKLQPNVIINNRLGGGFKGDIKTVEQGVPKTSIGDQSWETCMTINDTWGYKSYDKNYKSSSILVHNLINVANQGGNYLLNIGPDASGRIPAPEVERLKDIGNWLRVYGESIYGTSATPFKTNLKWGACTRKGEKLYLIVFHWPTDGKLLVPVLNENTTAWLLADRTKQLKCKRVEGGVSLEVPDIAPNPIASVVVFNLRGMVKLAATSDAYESSPNLSGIQAGVHN